MSSHPSKLSLVFILVRRRRKNGEYEINAEREIQSSTTDGGDVQGRIVVMICVDRGLLVMGLHEAKDY